MISDLESTLAIEVAFENLLINPRSRGEEKKKRYELLKSSDY